MKLFDEDGDPNESFRTYLEGLRKSVERYLRYNASDNILELRAANDRINNEVSIGIYHRIMEVRHEQRMEKPNGSV
jgi:hypothetical protein